MFRAQLYDLEPHSGGYWWNEPYVGGRGSFFAAFLAAILLVGIIDLTTFLNFNIALTFAMTGSIVLIGVALYSTARKEH